MNKQQQLDILISSQEDMNSKKALTPRGEGYLEGLRSARKIIFGEESKQPKGPKTNFRR